MRWLADQRAAFVMLDRDGTVLLATGPVGPRDARLRRAQALAHNNGIAVSIARELIRLKLVQQARIARDRFGNERIAGMIAAVAETLESVDTVRERRRVEAQAALAYWSLMRTVAVDFPRATLARVPEHWRTFGTRHSPLTNSPRLSVNPPNAMLNYLYALLESESRLAAAALGLDPGLAFLHADTSFARAGSRERRAYTFTTPNAHGRTSRAHFTPENACVVLSGASDRRMLTDRAFATHSATGATSCAQVELVSVN